MGLILGLMCEKLTGHRMAPWVRLIVPEAPLLRMEQSRCSWCRQGYVRPMPLEFAERRTSRPAGGEE